MTEHNQVYRDDGTLDFEDWSVNGSYHRRDRPAIISYHLDGITVYEEEWMIDGMFCRLDGGPSKIVYAYTGLREEAYWLQNNSNHPAGKIVHIYYDEDGKEAQRSWWIESQYVDIDELAKYIALSDGDKVAIKLAFG